MEQVNVINILRTLSRVEEMGMDTEGYSLRAEVESSGATVKNVNNGAITDRKSGAHAGSFNTYAKGSISVSVQGVLSREERAAVYEAVEDFIEGVRDKITGRMAVNNE